MPSKPIIAIDGEAASGKGTLGRRLAQTLNYAYLDTGALYRGTGLRALKNNLDPSDAQQATKAAEMLMQDIAASANPAEILSDPELKSDEAGKAASLVGPHPDVRRTLFDLQVNFAKNPGNRYKGAILDGRDIGTVICPNADLKLYITANIEIRAERRTKELQFSERSVTYEAVLKDMRDRDKRDAGRTTAPMEPASDAIIIDTSHLEQDDVFEKALELVRSRNL